MENKKIDLEFSIKNSAPAKQRGGCLVVGVFEGGKLSEAAIAIDELSGGYLTEIVRTGDMAGKANKIGRAHV